jgi:D-sedoheptulose 7-phosphate isomerase
MTTTVTSSIYLLEAPLAAGWQSPEKCIASFDPDTLRRAIDDHLHVVKQLNKQQQLLESIATKMIEAFLSGGKVFWCGNGGSAADCQHLAAEFVGRFLRERRALASIALTTDTSILTAIGNDYGFEEIFRRQVEALCSPRDVLVAISTSGSSTNVCTALNQAKQMGVFTVGLTGSGGAEMARICDVTVTVASKETARIQEAHILIGHLLCDCVERAICSNDAQMAGD